MNFHHLFYKTCTYTHTSNTTHRACPRPPDEKDTFLNDRRLTLQSLEVSKIKIKIRKKCFSYLFFYFWNFKRLWTHNHRLVNIQYWSVDGKYRIYLTRLRNGVKDELLASLSPRFAPSQINSIFTVNRPILYLSCNPRCPKK